MEIIKSIKNKRIICWWSGGVTSAVSIYLAIQLFGKENIEIFFIDTYNEDEDTYRFKSDCEKLYGIRIETLTRIGVDYTSIEHVWRKHKSLNVATGAICSSELKRKVRTQWEKDNEDIGVQVFGFDIDESKRIKSMKLNLPDKVIFTLAMFGYDKKDCIKILDDLGIQVPRMYLLGFLNNNCFGTGCVQGGIGYWQKMKSEYPDKFNRMADMEWELTESKGEPVTMLKDQGKLSKKAVKETGVKWLQFVFLRKHPDYPMLKSIDDFPQYQVEPLFECNGMCYTNDLVLDKPETYNQLNFNQEI